ncbi:hypothetical protein N0V90_000117 [Kalmusia sp. IMI 367209]|nr:hypothetical protein N0V90_000117 [Kalmusia sp. IMI 367209]
MSNSSIISPSPPEKIREEPIPGAMAVPPTRVLVLDLGGVLFHWSADNLTALSRKTFHAVITSEDWATLERGEIAEQDAVQRIAASLSIQPDDVVTALEQCRPTMRVDIELMDKLIKIKEHGKLKVYAMTNVSVCDFSRMKAMLSDWALFDEVYTSFELASRKPEVESFKCFASNIGVDAKDIVFVDDTAANVDAATSLGWRSLLFNSPETLIDQLGDIFLGPIAQGKAWLKNNARRLVTDVEPGKSFPSGVSFPDTFSQFLIMDAIRDPSLLHLRERGTYENDETDEYILNATSVARQWNYFIDEPVGTSQTFPDDVDTTSYAVLAFGTTTGVNAVLDAMLANRNEDGLIQTYWDSARPRIDICVLTNVARVFYKNGRGADIQNELAYIHGALVARDYTEGTRHYITAETFFFFLSQLIAANPNATEVQDLREPLQSALLTRVGVYDKMVDSLCVAMRVLACQSLGLNPEPDMSRLKAFQGEDGSWPLGWVCRYGKTKERLGNRGVVTAFAVKALETELFDVANGCGGYRERAQMSTCAAP